ncbi:hypothetical protein C8Q72DRAFT_954915 [Fomitopsis betulina]|nr:hypothetical protein C8Q72DRAFT_954915 [Fomitopsis betulina]
MIPQLLQRVALRSIHAVASRGASLRTSVVATCSPAPTRSFLTASQPLFARSSSAETATEKTGTKKPSSKPKKPKARAKAKPSKPKKAKPIIIKRSDLPPKPPLNTMAFFVREYFETHPKAPSMEEGRTYFAAAVDAYNSLDAAGKQLYADRRKVLIEEHKKEVEEWYRNTDPRKLMAIRKYFNAHRGRLPPNPDNRPANAFARFTSQYYKEHPGSRMVDMVKAAAQEWKTLPDAEKTRYKDEATKAIAEWEAKRAQASSTA